MFTPNMILLGRTLGLIVLGLAALSQTACGPIHQSMAIKKYRPDGIVVDVALDRRTLAVHYIEAGKGPTVVLLHGSPGSVYDFRAGVEGQRLSMWDRLISSHHVVAVDLPGHGHTGLGGRSRITPMQQVDLLDEVVTRLDLPKPFILIGYSWGGGLALLYAQKHDVDLRGLVLLSPVVTADSSLKQSLLAIFDVPILSSLAGALVGGPIAAGIVETRLVETFAPASVPKDYLRRARTLWARPSELRAMRSDSKYMYTVLQSRAERHAEIESPMVVITGKDDTLVLPERHAKSLGEFELAAANDNCTVYKSGKRIWLNYDNAGHAIPHTLAKEVVEIVSCLHRGACTHYSPCPHRKHDNDPEHAFDFAHLYEPAHDFDLKHDYDTLHKNDFSHQFDPAHRFDTAHPHDYAHYCDYHPRWGEIPCRHPVPCIHRIRCDHQKRCEHPIPCQHIVGPCKHRIPCKHRGDPCTHKIPCTHRVPCVHAEHESDVMHPIRWLPATSH